MTERNIGSVVVHDPEADGPGILTERDIVRQYRRALISTTPSLPTT